MNVDILIIGLVFLLLGILGLAIESNKSAKEKQERVWSYSLTQFILGIWILIFVGAILTIIGILGDY
ncbi:hypothetical protein SAMN04489724_3485 [Algoriphagus locisalis]|uniref:Uncharacterized protein n=1 Tax=Algoriphagus locisalis TaxID=305507 RepID=A0A1I7CVF5_9BACT|nr:hypothetical protein SAMN04489724_3485 [Algoriphagus locisalis]